MLTCVKGEIPAQRGVAGMFWTSWRLVCRHGGVESRGRVNLLNISTLAYLLDSLFFSSHPLFLHSQDFGAS